MQINEGSRMRLRGSYPASPFSLLPSPFSLQRSGFTLIELLVVIAIIAILTGFIFPVLSVAREGSRKSTCEANLLQIYEAVKLYKLDYGLYPPDIWSPPPAGLTRPQIGLAGLYPTYLKNQSSLHCPDDVNQQNPAILSTTAQIQYDSYDGPDEYALSQNLAPAANTVQKYSLSRLPAGGNEEQLSRQLTLLYPSSGTVITWCTQHRPRNGAIPSPQKAVKDDIFLFLDGSVRRGTFAGFAGTCDANKGDPFDGYKRVDCP